MSSNVSNIPIASQIATFLGVAKEWPFNLVVVLGFLQDEFSHPLFWTVVFLSRKPKPTIAAKETTLGAEEAGATLLDACALLEELVLLAASVPLAPLEEPPEAPEPPELPEPPEPEPPEPPRPEEPVDVALVLVAVPVAEPETEALLKAEVAAAVL
ncbi:hypothetical protein EYZ11_009693 [Aspergillus tanneri]|uniref:Uncharacterized protein n=1 Tax=Aspergillus tanneri TaxID=1220188 RepID=A0A4S3JCL7_9EURO|nr:hypothetical protein EYZ11_009693 [Aspergillus tanneri]